MDPKLTYYGKVTDRVIIHRSKEMQEMILQHFAGKDIQFTIERKKKRRTLSQNAYLHVLFTMFTGLLNEEGNTFTMPEIKEMLKYKFLKVDVVNEDTGEKIGERVRHTSELSTMDFNVFIEEVIRYGSEMFGFQLPYPNEQIEINL